jgi:hypothetical protein
LRLESGTSGLMIGTCVKIDSSGRNFTSLPPMKE